MPSAILDGHKAISNEPWYNSYRMMMDRCYRKNAANYKYYGGRGITVCLEWHDPNIFKIWAESSGYRKGLTIDRLDADGNYCPENCKWSTQKQQCNNRRNTVFIEYNGETHSISEWADIFGINHSTLKNRYYRGKRGTALFEKELYRRCKG